MPTEEYMNGVTHGRAVVMQQIADWDVPIEGDDWSDLDHAIGAAVVRYVAALQQEAVKCHCQLCNVVRFAFGNHDASIDPPDMP